MANNLTGVDYLGCIYDIYGYYARANSVNTAKRIFNLPDADTITIINDKEYYYPKEAIGYAFIDQAFTDKVVTIH